MPAIIWEEKKLVAKGGKKKKPLGQNRPKRLKTQFKNRISKDKHNFPLSPGQNNLA